MKHRALGALLCACFLIPSVAHAKGVPLFFNTGDELFEIEGAPQFGDGYSLGYACKRFGVFGADLWTWDCELMAINVEEFAVADLPPEMLSEFQQQYSLSDRKRGFWNHYGAATALVLLIGFAGFSARSKKSQA